MRGVREAAVALAVARHVGGLFQPDRESRGSPYLAGAFVAEINRLAGGIDHVVVGPRRNLIFVAIERPGGSRAGLRHKKSEVRIRNHIDPGLRRAQPFTEHDRVLAAIFGKSAEAVEILKRWLRHGHIHALGRASRPDRVRGWRFRILRPRNLLRKRSSAAQQARLAPRLAAGPASARLSDLRAARISSRLRPAYPARAAIDFRARALPSDP